MYRKRQRRVADTSFEIEISIMEISSIKAGLLLLSLYLLQWPDVNARGREGSLVCQVP